jgi:hypothetical protein
MNSQIIMVRSLDVGESVSKLSLSDESVLTISKGTTLPCVAEGSTVSKYVAISRVLSSIRSGEPLVLSTDNINKFDSWFPVKDFVTLVPSSSPKSVNQDPIPKKKGPVNMTKKKSQPVKAEICQNKVTPKFSHQNQIPIDDILARIKYLETRDIDGEEHAIFLKKSLTEEINNNKRLMGLVNTLSDRMDILESRVKAQESEITNLKDLNSELRLELEDISNIAPDNSSRICTLEKSFARVSELVKEELTTDVSLSRVEVSSDVSSIILPVNDGSSSDLIDNAITDFIRMSYAKQILCGFTQKFSLNDETTRHLRAAGFILDEGGALKPVVF